MPEAGRQWVPDTRPASDRAGLDEEDEGGSAEPAEERELDARGRPERAGDDEVDEDPDDQRGARLGEAEEDLEDEVAHGRQTARRPWSARIRVTSSAYSRSPPTGRPRAIRLTSPTLSSRRSARYIAVASPSSVGFVARITSTIGSPARFASSARPRSSRILSRSGPMPSI